MDYQALQNLLEPTFPTPVSLLTTICQPCSTTAAAATSLQSCPTLCDLIDSSPPGSPIPGRCAIMVKVTILPGCLLPREAYIPGDANSTLTKSLFMVTAHAGLIVGQ